MGSRRNAGRDTRVRNIDNAENAINAENDCSRAFPALGAFPALRHARPYRRLGGPRPGISRSVCVETKTWEQRTRTLTRSQSEGFST
jgi:hypothetical protein